MLIPVALTLTLWTSPSLACEQEAQVPWFDGTAAEAFQHAALKERLVLLEFWTDWCKYCPKLERETLGHELAQPILRSLVPLKIDAESAAGSKLAERYGVGTYPTLLFLDASGAAQDVLQGFQDVTTFVAEARRIQSGRDTIGDLRRQAQVNPQDLALTYRLATKLELVGARKEARSWIAHIEKLDPKAETEVMRTILAERARARLRELVREVTSEYEVGSAFDASAIERYLPTVQIAEVRFDGWNLVASLYEQLGYTTKFRQAQRQAWPDCPLEFVSSYGNQLAWNYYEDEERLSDEEKAFALSVAERAAKAAPNEPDVLDTLACCYRMQGELGRAIELAERCVELDPGESDWRDRLQELRALRAEQLERGGG